MKRSRRRLIAGALFLRIDGGCDDCSAWTDLLDHGGHVYSMVIRHDTTCPAVAARQAATRSEDS